jgi:hypothetical protein
VLQKYADTYELKAMPTAEKAQVSDTTMLN